MMTAKCIAAVQLAVALWNNKRKNKPIEIARLTPSAVKKLITGNGRADKTDVKKAVATYTGMTVNNNHAADAAAVAIAHRIHKLENDD